MAEELHLGRRGGFIYPKQFAPSIDIVQHDVVNGEQRPRCRAGVVVIIDATFCIGLPQTSCSIVFGTTYHKRRGKQPGVKRSGPHTHMDSML